MRSAPAITESQFLALCKIAKDSHSLSEFLDKNNEMVRQFKGNATVIAHLVASLTYSDAKKLLETHEISLNTFPKEDDVVSVQVALFNRMLNETDSVVNAVDDLDNIIHRITKIEHVIILMNLILKSVMNSWYYKVSSEKVDQLLAKLADKFSTYLTSLKDIPAAIKLLHELQGKAEFIRPLKIKIFKMIQPNIRTWVDFANALAELGPQLHGGRNTEQLLEDQKELWLKNPPVKPFLSTWKASAPSMDKPGLLAMIHALNETYLFSHIIPFLSEHQKVVVSLNHDKELIAAILKECSSNDLQSTINKFGISLKNFSSDADKSAITLAVIRNCDSDDMVYLLEFLSVNKTALKSMNDMEHIIDIIQAAKSKIEACYYKPNADRFKFMDEVINHFKHSIQQVADVDSAVKILSALGKEQISWHCRRTLAESLTNTAHNWDDVTTILQHVHSDDFLHVFDIYKTHLTGAQAVASAELEEHAPAAATSRRLV